MFEQIIAYLIFTLLLSFLIIAPMMIFLDRKRKSTLKEILCLCDPQEENLKKIYYKRNE